MVTVGSQAYIFLCSILGGMIIALLYDVFRILRKAFKTRNLMIYLEDILFWLLVAVVMFATVYYSNEGELRGYIFLGAFLGVVLYAMIFSKAVMNSSLFVIRIITAILKFIWMILTFPFRLLTRLLSIPLKLIGRYSGKSFRYLRRVRLSNLSKAKLWSRAFKNMRKKI